MLMKSRRGKRTDAVGELGINWMGEVSRNRHAKGGLLLPLDGNFATGMSQQWETLLAEIASVLGRARIQSN